MSAMSQRTLVLLKPDTVRRGLVGNVLSRFEAKGLTIVALEQRHIDAAQADAHYAEHVERDFYPPLRAFVTSGPLVALVLEGDEAIEVVRAINGATDGRKAAPGTIRGDLSLSNRENLVHGSDSEESADARDRPLVPRARLSPRRGAGQTSPRWIWSSSSSRLCSRSPAGTSRSGPCRWSTANPCTADQHRASAPSRRSAVSPPAVTRSSRTQPEQGVGVCLRQGSSSETSRLGIEDRAGVRGEGDLEEPRLGQREVHVGAAGRPQPGDRARQRLLLARRVASSAVIAPASCAIAAAGHLGEQLVPVGEVAVGRVVRDPGLPGDLTQHDALGPARLREADRRLDEGGAQVAVVVGAHAVILTEC